MWDFFKILGFSKFRVGMVKSYIELGEDLYYMGFIFIFV